jgi:hypothetical protein
MMMNEPQPVTASTEELRHRLQVLEMEYEMTRRKLDIGLFARDGAILSLLAGLILAAVVLIVTGQRLFAGGYFAAIIGFVAVGLIAYFVTVRRKAANLELEIAQTRQLLTAELTDAGVEK